MPLTTIEPDVGKIQSIFDRLVDPFVGIVHHIESVSTEPGTPNFFHYSALAANTGAFSEQVNFSNTGGASSFRSVAIAKAVGEAVERYSAALYQQDKLLLHNYENAPYDCVDPSDFALHSEKQYASAGFPWIPFTKDTSIRWTPALNLTTLKPIYIPAAFTWIPYTYKQGSGDSPIGQPISTGLACHETLDKSVLSGLYEVVERDAFTIMWQARLSMPHIRIETLSDENYDLVRRFEVTGDKVYLLNITLDMGITSVLSILKSEQAERPAYVFAASVDANPERAVRKALEELAHTRRYSQQIKDYLSPIENIDDYDQIRGQMDHLNYAADHRNKGNFTFVLTSTKRMDFDNLEDHTKDTPKQTLMSLVALFKAQGYQVLTAELTSEDVRELGLYVTRTIIPGFHPLFMGHQIRATGGKRLWEIPAQLGYPAINPESGDNPTPHPYP